MTTGAKARQNNENATVVLIFMAPSNIRHWCSHRARCGSVH